MKPVIRVQRVIGIVVLVAASAVAQVGRPVTAAARQQNNAARHRWQTTGRSLPGASSAALRHNALQQKSRMRALRNLSAPTGGISGAWISLGPLPLPSDASGIGLQDYNWVSGRATTVAIDPNDVTGNTVYAGGAYGGVWKSTNAGNLSPSPVSVNWAPLPMINLRSPSALLLFSRSSGFPTPPIALCWLEPAKPIVQATHTTAWEFCAPQMPEEAGVWSRRTQPELTHSPDSASVRSHSAQRIRIRWSPRQDRRPRELLKAWRIR